jgi:hypothetical protein
VTAIRPWIAIAALGAYHGLDPSMGWLFAVALELQERRRAKVFAALGPIALGHLVSIGTVVRIDRMGAIRCGGRHGASGMIPTFRLGVIATNSESHEPTDSPATSPLPELLSRKHQIAYQFD